MRKTVAVILLALFATGLFIRTVPVKTGVHYWDETVYLQHGKILAGDHPNNYNEFDFRPPLYSLLIGGIFLFTDSLVHVHLILSFLASLGIVATFLLGRRLYGDTAGLIGAGVFMVSLQHIRFSHDVLVDPHLPLLWVGVAFATLRLLETERPIYGAVTGGSIALAVLGKFTALVLLPAVAAVLVLDRYREEQDWADAVHGAVTSRAAWMVGVGFVVVFTPYLLWSWWAYGSPLHVFFRAWQLNGAKDPFLTYLGSSKLLLTYPVALGLFLLAGLEQDWLERDVLLPVTFTLALYLPLQFLVDNREIRFMFPVLPFLAVLIGRGFDRVRQVDRRVFGAVLAGVAVLAVPMVLGQYHVQAVAQGNLTMEEYTPVYDAAQWLKAETSADTIVYTNTDYPQIGYYSGREIRLIANAQDAAAFEQVLKAPGYIYYSEQAPDRFHPSLQALRDDERFVMNRTFSRPGRHEVYIFYYRGG